MSNTYISMFIKHRTQKKPRTIMTAQNQTNDLNAIKTSLLKIAQDIGQPVPAPGQAPAPAADGSPEQVLGLIDDAIEVLEVAAETVPAEGAAAPGQPAPALAKSKSAQEGEKENEKEGEGKTEGEGEKKEATKDEDTEKEKELKARIAALEDDKEEKEKEKVAKEFVQLYPENIRQAKFDAIIASEVKSAVLTEQFKVAQDLSDATTNKSQYVPIKVSSSGFLTKQASLKQTVPAWRT